MAEGLTAAIALCCIGQAVVTMSTKTAIAPQHCSQAIPLPSLTVVVLTSHQLPSQCASVWEQIAKVMLPLFTALPYHGTFYRLGD